MNTPRKMHGRVDNEIVADLFLSDSGFAFVEELVERFGPRFGGTSQEQQAGEFIRGRFMALQVDGAYLETFTCPGWTRRQTALDVVSPVKRKMDCIALPYCPPGMVEAPLVYVGEGDPRTYEAKWGSIKGTIAMASTAVPRFQRRSMHRYEKLARALDAGAVGFIWMRAVRGGLPETGSARFGRPCEVPAIGISFETGYELLRTNRKSPVHLKINSTNENHPVTSHNVVAEFRGCEWPDEIVVLGAHYDGHDISESATDNASGLAVLLEAARALGRHRDVLRRTVRLVAFAQEEMGLHGAGYHIKQHEREAVRFMLNLDGIALSSTACLETQGWPEAADFLRGLVDNEIIVDDQIDLYADQYPFVAHGIPSAILKSAPPAEPTATFRGFGHTPVDSLDKISPRLIQIDAIRVARLILRLAIVDEIPIRRKTATEIRAKLAEAGLDAVLRFERRPVPGEE